MSEQLTYRLPYTTISDVSQLDMLYGEVSMLTVFMSIPSARLIMILLTPVSRYFHLQQLADNSKAFTTDREHTLLLDPPGLEPGAS